MKKTSVVYVCLLIAVVLFIVALLETSSSGNGENQDIQTISPNSTTEAVSVNATVDNLDETSGSQVGVGVLIAVVGALAAGLGDCCVKLGHSLMADEREESGGTLDLLSQGRAVFIFGWSCAIAINTVCTLVAFAYAGAAVVLPISGLHIAATVVLAWPINGERLLWSTVCIVAMICFGVVIIVLASDKDTPEYDLEHLQNRFSSAPEAALMLVFTASMVGVCLCLHYYVLDQGPRHEMQRTLALSLASGFSGTVTNVLAISVVRNVGVASSWSSGFFWTLLLSLAGAAIIQVTTLNNALKRYNTSTVVPVVNSTLVGVGTLVATIVYAEYESMSSTQLLIMSLGLFVVVVGIVFLSDPDPTSKDRVQAKGLKLTDSLSETDEELGDKEGTNGGCKDKGKAEPCKKRRWRMCPLMGAPEKGLSVARELELETVIDPKEQE